MVIIITLAIKAVFIKRILRERACAENRGKCSICSIQKKSPITKKEETGSTCMLQENSQERNGNSDIRLNEETDKLGGKTDRKADLYPSRI